MKFTFATSLAVCWLALAGEVHADQLLASVDVAMKEPIRLVAEWESDRVIAFGLVAVVFILGAVIAISNTLPPPAAKAGVVVLGSAVTLLTALSNAYFEFDHRQYKTLASQGRHLLAEIDIKKNYLSEMPLADRQAREGMFEEIRRHVNAIMDLPNAHKNRHPGVKAARFDMLVGPAHAQQAAKPDWLVKLPEDKENLYFVGYADGAEYVRAREASLQRAFLDARSFLTARLDQKGTGGVEATAAADYLLTSARVLETFSQYDKNLNAFKFYTLLSLSRRIAESDLRLYSAKTNQRPLPAQEKSLQDAARSQNDYLSNRLNTYSREMDKAQGSLSTAQYQQFTRARKARHESRPRDAIQQFNDLLQGKPDFYLAWFNLALAHEDVGDTAAAAAAYERAVALEKTTGLRDASLYNTYGYFLFRQKQYPQAISHLRQALEIAPDHPTARGTLAAAQAASAGR